MPQVLGAGNLKYTVLSTAGTTTLDPGPASGVRSQPGVLGGVIAVGLGTAWAFTAYDILPPPTPGAASPGTNTLLNGTATAAGQAFAAGVPGFNPRVQGALVIVTAGTPGVFNALWD